MNYQVIFCVDSTKSGNFQFFLGIVFLHFFLGQLNVKNVTFFQENIIFDKFLITEIFNFVT